jgi:hypothetical protein
MKRLIPFALGLLLVATACDPGMTIYQTNTNQNVSGPERVTIRVEASHPLIGETWYAPDNVRVINSFDKPIVITRVELVANGTTYQHKHMSAKDEYPLTIAAGKTQVIPIWFDLNDSVNRTFNAPAELRVYYRESRNESVAHAFIVGGPLHMKMP